MITTQTAIKGTAITRSNRIGCGSILGSRFDQSLFEYLAFAIWALRGHLKNVIRHAWIGAGYAVENVGVLSASMCRASERPYSQRFQERVRLLRSVLLSRAVGISLEAGD